MTVAGFGCVTLCGACKFGVSIALVVVAGGGLSKGPSFIVSGLFLSSLLL